MRKRWGHWFSLKTYTSLSPASRMRCRSLPARGILAILFVLGVLPTSLLAADPPKPESAALSRVLDAYAKLPQQFEPNLGQTDPKVKFLSRGRGYTLFLTPSEAVLALRQNTQSEPPSLVQRSPAKPDPQWIRDDLLEEFKPKKEPRLAAQEDRPGAILRSRLVGMNSHATLSAIEELPGKSNYFIGNDPKKWHSNVTLYGKVKYHDVYPGVDLVYYGNQGQLEYDFVISPGANSKQIRLEITGGEVSPPGRAHNAKALRIDVNGDLVIISAAGEVRYRKPVAYQIAADGGKQLVAARFMLRSKYEVGFAVPSYDRAKALVIDPTLVYSTYIAGASPGPFYFGYTGDQAAGIAVDSKGSAYITGLTESADFPITQGAYQTACKPYGQGCSGVPNSNPSSAYAVFVTKLSPDGSSLVYSTYLGGGYNDNGTAIAVDSSGNAYIAGQTMSPDFPVTPGAYQTTCGPRLDSINGAYCDGWHIVSTCGPLGYPDGFVTKLNPTGSALVYSTFLGGSLNDYLTGIAVNSAGEAYVSGITLSSYSYGPPGQCGCPGGGNSCSPNYNLSASYGYPITPGGYFPGPLPMPPGGQQWPFGAPSAFSLAPANVSAFPFSDIRTPVFSKLSADGSTMLYSTYIGGGLGPVLAGSQGWGDGQTFYPYLQQNATGIAIDSSGNAYMTGYSNASDQCCTQFNNYQFTGFPTTAGVVQPHNASACASSNCAYDGFVAKFDPTQSGASSLVYSTNLGGAGDDYANAIAVDSGGNAYVAGTANETGYNAPPTFPTTPGTIEPNCPGNCNSSYGWVAKLNSTATALDYSTYLSGTSANNSPAAIAVDSAGNAYVAGQTGSADFPQQNPLQGFVGPTDAFVSVLDPTASTLLFSTFLSGSNGGQTSGAAGIALDSSENMYVTGSTNSSAFPTTTGAFQATCTKCATGSWGTFVAEISAAASPQAPTITSANSTTFTVGKAGSFKVTTTGSPVPSLTESGALPSGVTFHDNGDGTGTLSGTTTTIGTFNITFTAHNGVGSDAIQTFTLTTVGQAPTITSASSTTFTVGAAGSFTVTTTGNPTAGVTETGALPTGVTFTDNGDGTGTLGGTPAAGTGGSYPITFTAHNGVGTDATQNFTLTVNQGPAITSASSTTFSAGTAGAFTVTATGSPTPTLSEAGTLPSGVTFNTSTGVLGGTPAAGTGGSYPITFTAHNGVGTDATQNFTLTVRDFSLSVSPASQTVSGGKSASYTVTVSPVSGFTGTVSLTCSSTEPGSSCAVKPNSLLLGGTQSAKATVTPPKKAATGTFNVTINGTSGTLAHSVNASLTVK